MLIDWFTVVAQIVNFLVLVALLKHFLFGRLVKAIDERKKKVAAFLAEAEAKSKEAERQVEQERARALELEQKRDEMLAEAQRQASEKRDEMIQKTREEVRKLEAKWREDLEREQTAFLDEIRRRAGKEILAVVRRALADLASSEVQHSAIETLLERLRSFDVAALHELTRHELTVSTPSDLPEETRQKIRDTIETRLGSPVKLCFDRAPEMRWGVELRGNGQRLGWNSDTYVDALEENLKEALERRVETVVT